MICSQTELYAITIWESLNATFLLFLAENVVFRNTMSQNRKMFFFVAKWCCCVTRRRVFEYLLFVDDVSVRVSYCLLTSPCVRVFIAYRRRVFGFHIACRCRIFGILLPAGAVPAWVIIACRCCVFGYLLLVDALCSGIYCLPTPCVRLFYCLSTSFL